MHGIDDIVRHIGSISDRLFPLLVTMGITPLQPWSHVHKLKFVNALSG